MYLLFRCPYHSKTLPSRVLSSIGLYQTYNASSTMKIIIAITAQCFITFPSLMVTTRSKPPRI